MSILLVGNDLNRTGDFMELLGHVHYDRARAEDYVFRFPAKLESQVTLSGDPWLVILLPLAVHLGVPLQLQLPVDERLLSNAYKIMEIWYSWDARLKPVPVEAVVQPEQGHSGGKIGQFFTAGVDSFFTAGRYDLEHENAIDEFIFIRGYNAALENESAWQHASEIVVRCGESLGKETLLMATNLRHTHWSETRWPEHSFGAALIGSGLMLQDRYKRLVLPASWDQGQLIGWGSHPDTDVLYSTSKTEIIHFGVPWTRVQRTKWLAEGPIRDLVFRYLRVCNQDAKAENCSRCGKCLRTMATLGMIGALDKAQTFKEKDLVFDRIEHHYLSSVDRIYMDEVRRYASENGREDLKNAIDKSLQHSEEIDRRFKVPLLRSLGMDLKRRYPRFWRAILPLRNFAKFVVNLVSIVFE